VTVQSGSRKLTFVIDCRGQEQSGVVRVGVVLPKANVNGASDSRCCLGDVEGMSPPHHENSKQGYTHA
jgi:hypothetical protein